MSSSNTPEQQEAQITLLRKQLEELKSETQEAQQQSQQRRNELENQRQFNERLTRKLKHQEHLTKELEEKIMVEREGGTDKLATLESLQDSYLEMIEQELNQVELDVMSVGDLSRFLIILNDQMTRINQERDRRELFIQRKIDRLEKNK